MPQWMNPQENHHLRDSHPAVIHWKKTSVTQTPLAKDKLEESTSMRGMLRKLCRWKGAHLVIYEEWRQFCAKLSMKIEKFHTEMYKSFSLSNEFFWNGLNIYVSTTVSVGWLSVSEHCTPRNDLHKRNKHWYVDRQNSLLKDLTAVVKLGGPSN